MISVVFLAAASGTGASGCLSTLPGGEDRVSLCAPGGLTIQAAIERAESVSPAFEDSAVAIEEARAERRTARARMLPRWQLSASYQRLSNVENPPLFPPVSAEEQQASAADIASLEDPAAQRLWERDTQANQAEAVGGFPVIQNNWTFEHTVEWSVLDTILADRKSYRAAGFRLDARELEQASVRRDIRLNAVRAYHNLVVAKGREQIANDSLRRSLAVEQEVKALVESGSTLQSELLRVRSQSARFRGDVIEAGADRESAARILQTLLDLPTGADLALSFSLPELTSVMSFDDAWRNALEQREEFAALDALANAAEREAQGLLFEQLPDVVLSGGNRTARPNLRIIPPVDEFRSDWSVGVTVAWSPTGFLESRGRTATARAQEKRQRLALVLLRDQIRDRVAVAHARARSTLAVVETSRVELESAQEAYRVRRVQYPAGLTTLSDLIDSEAELSNAQLRLLNSTVRAIIERASLFREIGRDLNFLSGDAPQ